MNRPLLVAGTLALAFALASPAAADKPDKGKGKKKDRKADVTVAVGFSAGERDLVRVYFVEKHGKGKCPPGLAKKKNGCLPPGQAKKRYARGERLPAGVEIRPVPADLEVRVGPPPRGYRYGVVDGDLVKLAVGTLLVVDAIEGLVD